MPRKRTDLSNYPIILKLINELYSELSPEDQQDLAHDVCVKLLGSGVKQANAALICQIIKQQVIEARRRKPAVVYNSDYVDKLTGERS